MERIVSDFEIEMKEEFKREAEKMTTAQLVEEIRRLSRESD